MKKSKTVKQNVDVLFYYATSVYDFSTDMEAFGFAVLIPTTSLCSSRAYFPQDAMQLVNLAIVY